MELYWNKIHSFHFKAEINSKEYGRGINCFEFLNHDLWYNCKLYYIVEIDYQGSEWNNIFNHDKEFIRRFKKVYDEKNHYAICILIKDDKLKTNYAIKDKIKIFKYNSDQEILF